MVYLVHKPYSVSSASSGDKQLKTAGEDMKIRFLLALVGLAIGFAAPALAQLKDTVDPKTAQEIRALAMKYDAALNKQDPAAVAALYAEDAYMWRSTEHFTVGRPSKKRMQTISSIGIPSTMSL